MTNPDVATNLIAQFIDSKIELQKRFESLLTNGDGDKMVECLVENMVEDIYMVAKIYSIRNGNPKKPLDDATKEQLKTIIFDVLKGDPSCTDCSS